VCSSDLRSGVFVRVKETKLLEAALIKKKIAYTVDGEGLHIAGKKSDDIGKLAFSAGVTVLELANHSASLEEAFLDLTSEATEYASQTAEGEK
jgi:ABC-2 type transport system ATP-binding protein